MGLWRAVVGAAHHGPSLWYIFGHLDVFWPKFFSKKFRFIWTPFDIDFL
jgi:hypothetical protein